MQSELKIAVGMPTGRITEVLPQYVDERLSEYLEKIAEAFSMIDMTCYLPDKLMYGYVKFSVNLTPRMMKLFPIKTALGKAQWCMYTPPNGSEDIKTSDYFPEFMICEIPTAWEKDMIIAHIACLLLILNGKFRELMIFLNSPDNIDTKIDIEQLLDEMGISVDACDQIEIYADRLKGNFKDNYDELNGCVGLHINGQRGQHKKKKRERLSPKGVSVSELIQARPPSRVTYYIK